jgi:tRNA (adenine22-N1)-methyltransferase
MLPSRFAMVHPTLSPRLLALAQHVRAGQGMADIGTDHGYFPAYLVEHEVCPFAIACDLRCAPLAQAKANVERLGLESQVELRVSDGLSALSEDEVGSVTIAGMGGHLVASMLRRDLQRFCQAEKTIRFICQVNDSPRAVRELFGEYAMQLRHEEVVWERRYRYWIFVFEVGSELPKPALHVKFSQEELEYGVLVARAPNESYVRWLKHRLKYRTRRLNGLRAAVAESLASARAREETELGAETEALNVRLRLAQLHLQEKPSLDHE